MPFTWLNYHLSLDLEIIGLTDLYTRLVRGINIFLFFFYLIISAEAFLCVCDFISQPSAFLSLSVFVFLSVFLLSIAETF